MLPTGDYIVSDSTGDVANQCLLFLDNDLTINEVFTLWRPNGIDVFGEYRVVRITKFTEYTRIQTGQITLKVVPL